jgi:hypothetical protein
MERLMTDSLRDRVADALNRNLRRQQRIDRPDRFVDWIDTRELADAVIAALGTRRCERCRNARPLADFPAPHNGSDQMRPFCVNCTEYVEWATS